ncbi:hypothetical protein JCGZ_02211 [Jatropha curcas]|uniref:F-box domain-containing protein n=2 Tax=Jatropha curcas TaxID=180498 RepID=A0A067KZ62_JATCU|nr:hypothetical protein JCGZ_02211 [Jatropha curcas]
MKLASDIIWEILRRLPAADLVRFKSVSKAWYSIITHPQFLRDHLNYVSTAENEFRILVTHQNRFHSIFYHEEDNAQKKVPVLPPQMVIPEFTFVHGSCDGLLLFLAQRRRSLEENRIVICNPCTKKLIKMPITRPVLHFPDCYGPREDLFGLGYDPHTDDYKVLRFPSALKARENMTFDKKNGFNCLVEAYSLKTKSWKIIQDGGFMYLIKRLAPATVNRRPHWIATHITNPDSSQCVIFYFDAGKDNFGDMMLPPSVQENVSVHNYRGFLGLAEFSIQGEFILWSMKEYGKPDSWVKLLTIPNVPAPKRCIWHRAPAPVFITETGKVLFRTAEGQLGVYDGKDGKFIEPLIQGHSGGFLRGTPYVESLVSPSGGNLKW